MTSEMDEATALRHIREHLTALGIPVDDVSDDELREAVQAFSKAAAEFGVSTAEFVTIAGSVLVATQEDTQ